MDKTTPSLRAAVALENPLQIVGVINAYCALMAERVGYRALYISGAGTANYAYGLPDLGITSLNDVLEEVRRISSVTALPILVDADTGFGGAFNIARTVKQMAKAGAAAIHIEDQVQAKRCGHRPGKAIVSKMEMVDRIKMAVDAKPSAHFAIMARTDALQLEGLDAAIERASLCVEAGADCIFAEAMTDLSQYQRFAQAIKVPVLANLTEFGATPFYTVAELHTAGIQMILYPLSAARAMNAAALKIYQAIRQEGTQKNVVALMQPRAELYEFLQYLDYEKKLDELFAQKGEKL